MATPSGLEWQESGGIRLGRTIDQFGQPHTQVLHLAPGLERSVVMRDQLLAVVSGSANYSVTGDVALDDWRFSVDPYATGDAAPIVVLKFSRGALTELAKNPGLFFQPDLMNDDVGQAQARLNALIAFVISRAKSDDPDAVSDTSLEHTLQNPNWNGVLVFNASVSGLPAIVQGQSTAALANAPITAIGLGFTANPITNGAQTIDSSSAPSTVPGGPGRRAAAEQ